VIVPIHILNPLASSICHSFTT